jgi:hypothetical protein
MKTTFSLLIAALALATAAARADETAPRRTPLRPVSECIAIDRINEWHIVDDRTAIVRTGPDRYLVKLQHDCPRLGVSPGLLFRPNRANQAVMPGRICGEAGEAVYARFQPPCSIQSVSKIDKGRFDAFAARARRHGSGAEQPTLPPRP